MARRPDLTASGLRGIRLALCQVETAAFDSEGNTARLVAALEAARAQGADLALTPECVLHGYGFPEDFRRTGEKLAEVAERIDGPRMTFLRDVCRRLSLPAVIGFAETDGENRFFNSAAFIAADGAILSVYRKVHLRPFEDVRLDGAFTAGDAFSVVPFEIRGEVFRIGTFICFDREVTESARCLRALGADLVLCPLATRTTDIRDVDLCDNEMITRVRACENEMFIAVVNHAVRFNGGSFVVGPGGEILHTCGAGPAVETVFLPLEAARTLHAAPRGWMGFGFRRPEVYDAYLGSRTRNTEEGEGTP